MALTAFYIVMTATTLLLPMTIMAQKNDVTIKVRAEKNAQYFYTIAFNNSVFTQFHECMCMGYTNCTVTYGLGGCQGPNGCPAKQPEASGSAQTGTNHYYKCIIVQPRSQMVCEKQAGSEPTAVEPNRYHILNSNYSSICVELVWTLAEEGINFNTNELDVDTCRDDSTSSSRGTTFQPVTSSTKSSSTTTSSTSSPSPSSSLTSSTTPTRQATTQSASSDSTPTKLTITMSTANTSLPSPGEENAGDDPPFGIAVGAAVGAIVFIVIILIIVVVWRRRKTKAKASDHADHVTSVTSSNDVRVNSQTNDGTSHSYCNAEFSDNNSESHALNNGVIKTKGYQNSIHQPSISRDGVAPVKNVPKPQLAIKDNDSDFGYSTAQLVVPEDNNNINARKSRDDYDYVYAENDIGVSDPTHKTQVGKTPIVSPSKVKDDYAVVDKTRKNKTPGNMATSKGLTSDYEDIPQEDYGYSHAVGDASAQGTSDAAVGNAHVMVPKSSLLGASDLNQDFGYEYSRTSDGYTTVGSVNQPDPNKDDPNATSVYSRLHDPVRDIQNPYNVGPNTNDVYSKLHEEVRDIQNPYNVLPEAPEDSDCNHAIPDTAHNAHNIKEQKSLSQPYGKKDYAVVVKTKSANKPTRSTFELGND